MPDPYHVWLSEIMLQQTTVAAVRSTTLNFCRAGRTVSDLAAGHQDDVLKAWAGLGYYARARNLHACAIKVVERLAGRFPIRRRRCALFPALAPTRRRPSRPSPLTGPMLPSTAMSNG